MENVHCQCGKLVCQVDDSTVVLKCRHCKRFIIIRINRDIKRSPEIIYQ